MMMVVVSKSFLRPTQTKLSQSKSPIKLFTIRLTHSPPPKIHFFLTSKSNYSPIMPSMSNIVRFFAAFCVLSTVTSLSVPPAKQAKPMNRLSFLTTSCASAAAVLLAKPSPSFSKEIDPALKGTKADPKYQACLSECVYDCTKPKGDEQKSRAQCLPECKKQCATTKEQLMIGTPLQK